MSSVIILSSSPTRTFARSQTPVDVSSPPRPSAGLANTTGEYSHHFPFKDAHIERDGFSSNFTLAKHVLEPRISAENVPLQSLTPPRYTVTPHRAGPSTFRPPTDVCSSATLHGRQRPASITDPLQNENESIVIKVLPSDARRKSKKTSTAQLRVGNVSTKREHKTFVAAAHMSQSIPGYDFVPITTVGNHPTSAQAQRLANDNDGALTKRRKSSLQYSDPSTKSGLSAFTTVSAKTKKARTNSPVKKSLTITGLATSLYMNDTNDNISPMAEYFRSTQSKMNVDKDPHTFDTSLRKRNAKPVKAKSKSRLRSPTTAIETLDSQDFLFATASQLARDDSPTLLKDTIEAIRQSENHFHSSPIRSQQTAIFSTASTSPPKPASTRFQSRKNLWSAADRDEHDALLHSYNDMNPPSVKKLFAGKDALLNDTNLFPDVDEPHDSLALLTALQPDTTTFDIDDIETPPLPASRNPIQGRREYSTSSGPTCSKRTKTSDHSNVRGRTLDSHEHKHCTALSTSPQRKSIPPKPNYVSWNDQQLKEAVTAYGLKRLRARKSMIDKLDELWAVQHGLDPKAVKAATKKVTKVVKHTQSGDILGSVHGLAARPVAKAPKQRKRREQQTRGIVVDTGSKLLNDDVFDISDIENSAFDRLAAIKIPSEEIEDDDSESVEVPPSTAPVKGTGVRAIARPHRASNAQSQNLSRPLTPPPTNSFESTYTQLSSPGFEEAHTRALANASEHEIPASPSPTPEEVGEESLVVVDVDLKSRIYEAIHDASRDGGARNHYKNPTWHEKILLYDPIILEDLTVWLNTEGFNAIGEDREIDAHQVRDWCHANGICCLWRGGWRGNMKDTTEE